MSQSQTPVRSVAVVTDLFQQAHKEAELSQAALAVLTVPDVAAQIGQAMGIPVDDVKVPVVTLIDMLLDDSYSIRNAGNEQALMDGGNRYLDALRKSKGKDGILVHISTLNGKQICPYVPLADAPKITSGNYSADGGTPLYDQTVVAVGTAKAKILELREAGQQARAIVLVITDGHDEHSVGDPRVAMEKARDVVTDMRTSDTNLMMAMGIDNRRTNFHDVFVGMGFADKWILTPKNTPKEILAACELASQSAVTASQAAGTSFSRSSRAALPSPNDRVLIK